MTDKLKQIIEKATRKNSGTFRTLIFIPNGVYNGFWGPNGYDNIMILGQELRGSDEWFVISTTADVFNCYHSKSFNVDIPSDLGVPVIFFDEPVQIDNELDGSNVIARYEGPSEALAASRRRAKMCASTILAGCCPNDCERCAWSEIPYQKHKNC